MSMTILIDGATLRSLTGKAPAEESDPPEADLVFRAEVVDDMRQLLSRVGKSFKLRLLQSVPFEAETKPIPITLMGARLRGLSGKQGSEVSSAPLADMKVTVDVNADIQHLLPLVGKTFHLTFEPEAEQLGMFIESAEIHSDESEQRPAEPIAEDDDDAISEAEPDGDPLADVWPAANSNGTQAHAIDEDWSNDVPPPAVDEVLVKRLHRRTAAAQSGSETPA